MGRDLRIIAETPHNVALIRAGAVDATVAVEFYDTHGRIVPVNNASSVTITVSSTAKSLHYFITGGIPKGAVGGRAKVLTESVCVNTGGTDDGEPGVNNTGIVSAATAPTTSSPRSYGVGSAFDFGHYRPS